MSLKVTLGSPVRVHGPWIGSAKPEQAPSTPLVAAIDTWRERQGTDGRWRMEERGVRSQMARPGYVGSPSAQWWPLPSELRACCKPFETKLRQATSWPMTEALFRHCRSYEHVAALHNVSAKELRDAVRARRLTAALAHQPPDDVPF